MKKVLYIHQYYRRPDEPGTSRSHWVAEYLVKNGYKVVLITQKNSFNPENKKAPLIERTRVSGIDVLYIKNAYSNEHSIQRRIYSFLYFMFLSTYFAFKERNVSVLIATSTPISVGFPALMLKLFKKIKYIFEVRDLWPEVPLEMKIIKKNAIRKISKWYIKKIYFGAQHIIALSPGMKEGILFYKKSLRVSMIPNMSKIDHFYPREVDENLNNDLGLGSKTFKVIHFGTMGNVNGLENFVESALNAKKNRYNDVVFILVGSGKYKSYFRDFKMKHKIDNLKIFDRMPLDKISSLVNICDVSYIGVTKYKILEMNSANKFFDSLAAGKPIIINFGGWMQDIIEKENCGIRVKNNDPIDLLNAILYLKDNHELRKSMGNRARILAETQYDKNILCGQYEKVIESVL